MAVSSPESDRAGESSGARGWKGNLSGWEWRMTTGTGRRGRPVAVKTRASRGGLVVDRVVGRARQVEAGGAAGDRVFSRRCLRLATEVRGVASRGGVGAGSMLL